MPPQSKPEGCLERRFIRGGQVRAKGGEAPGIDGYSAVFNEEYDNGWFRETIKPGAFSRALREKQDVRCLFNHNPDNLLGRTKSKTLRLAEDNTGLRFDCDVNPETRVGVDVQGMIQRGDVDGCSFGFMVRKQSWREETDDEGRTISYRDIEDVDLFDVGPVTYPAYEGTSVAERSLWPNGVPAEVRNHVPALNAHVVEIVARQASGAESQSLRADMEECDCPCGACEDGNCADCDCDGCDSEDCDNDECRCGEERAKRAREQHMRLRLAEHS